MAAVAPPPPSSYGVTSLELKELVEAGLDSKGREEVTTNVNVKLEKFGGIDGASAALKCSLTAGITEASVEGRRSEFGENRLPREEPEALWQLMLNALKDPTLILLMISAVISIIFGLVFECITTGWIEGVAILVAVAVVDVVASVNDWQKDKQFQKLNALKDDISVGVVRDGTQKLISIFDIVVGDLVELTVGDMLCADGLFLSGNDLKVNEASLTGESDDLRKGPYAFNSEDKVGCSPFLFGGTKVMEGNGRMLVIAVGVNSYAGSSAQLMAEEEEEDSVLQKQLNKMAQQITLLGTGAAVIVVGVLILRLIIDFARKAPGYESFDKSTHPAEILNFFILAITVLVVAIPEGLPLAVTIALAFSVKKMLKDQNLVRHLSACETMGGATTICSDKTGTLTMNRMTVMRSWVMGKAGGVAGGGGTIANINDNGTNSNSNNNNNNNNSSNGTAVAVAAAAKRPSMESSIGWGMETDDSGGGISAAGGKLITEAIALNSSARLIFPPSGPPEHIGNKTECALLQFCHAVGLNYEEVRAAHANIVPKIYNFSSARKRMSSLWQLPTGELRLFSKGAPEILLQRCTHVLNVDTMERTPLSPEDRERLISGVLNNFAEQCLRTLCVAYRDIAADEAQSINRDEPETIEVNMTCLILVGIEDPVRPEVPDALNKCKIAGITVRMVTGDNIVTARSIAKKCGIADQIPDYLAMEGPEFRSKVVDKTTGLLNQSVIDTIWPRLLVLARSSPKDKHMLVSGIMASSVTVRQIVAVTGDGTNDGPALKKAHVGFAMGITGTSVAKEAADIIIMDDNFSSIVSAVKWGRCVYDNICKFLQFQLTVNIVAITVAVVGACSIEVSPLKAIHLLWINLIMDSLASLALATEGPTDDLLHRLPYGRDRPLLSPTMLRNMLVNATYQLGIMFYAIWGIYIDLGIPTGIPTGAEDNSCGADNITIHFTIVFNMFVFMQLFTEINSRRINNELNCFEGFFKNQFFLGVLFITAFLQAILVEFGNVAFQTTHLRWDYWLISMAPGVAEIFLYPFFFRYIPARWFEPLSRVLMSKTPDEASDDKEENKSDIPAAASDDGGMRKHSSFSLGGASANVLPRSASAYKIEPDPGLELAQTAAAAVTRVAWQPHPHNPAWNTIANDDGEPLTNGQLTPTPPDDLEPQDEAGIGEVVRNTISSAFAAASPLPPGMFSSSGANSPGTTTTNSNANFGNNNNKPLGAGVGNGSSNSLVNSGGNNSNNNSAHQIMPPALPAYESQPISVPSPPTTAAAAQPQPQPQQ